MARGNPNPSPATRWKPGQSGNPNGTPVSAEMKIVRRMSYDEFINALTYYGSLTPDQLKEMMKREDCSLMERGFGMLYGQFAQGDKNARDEIFNRLFGKVKDVIQHTNADTTPRITLSMPDNGRRAKVIDVTTEG